MLLMSPNALFRSFMRLKLCSAKYINWGHLSNVPDAGFVGCVRGIPVQQSGGYPSPTLFRYNHGTTERERKRRTEKALDFSGCDSRPDRVKLPSDASIGRCMAGVLKNVQF